MWLLCIFLSYFLFFQEEILSDKMITPAPPAMIKFSAENFSAKPMVAITFDDGPHPKTTPEILRVLDQHQVPATFFWVGELVQRFPQTAAIVRSRPYHEIGNHSWFHYSWESATADEISAEILRSNQLIKKLTGQTPRFVRPPYGWGEPAKISDYPTALWSIDPKDWDPRRTADEISAEILGSLAPRSIILLHEQSPQLTEFLPVVIEGIKAQGFQPVTLRVLMGEEWENWKGKEWRGQ